MIEGITPRNGEGKKKSNTTTSKKLNKPRGPRNGLNCYCLDMLASTKLKHPKFNSKQIFKQMGQDWALITDRRKWKKMQEQDKKRYEDEMKDFRDNSANIENDGHLDNLSSRPVHPWCIITCAADHIEYM